MKKIRLFEMFSGYGGASFALKKAGIPFACVGYSEIDKFAVQCYEQNHYDFHYAVPSYGDATKINPDELPDFDLLTGGFPCQSFSAAGKGLGEMDTRGTLFNDIIRIAEAKKPKYMLLENVKGLTFKKHKATFEKILSELKRIGYDVKWKVLNSKEHGIPQNRERIWFVCKLGQWDFNEFQFPPKEELKIFLQDVLEDEVDEKYYVKQEQVERIMKSSFNSRRALYQGTKKVVPCLAARDYKEPNIVQVNNPKHSNDRVYSDEGLSPTLNTMGGGNRQPFIVASRGRNPANPSDRTTGAPTQQQLEPKFDGTTNALTSVQKDNWVCDNTRIRKLTPKECFRLMGFLDDEINVEGLSNTQQYKLAGNGWDINLVSKIFKEMIKE